MVNRRLFAMAANGIKCDMQGNVYSGCGDGINVWCAVRSYWASSKLMEVRATSASGGRVQCIFLMRIGFRKLNFRGRLGVHC